MIRSVINKFKARAALKSLKNEKRNRKAFTLVEVLLVLAVATAIITIGLRIYSSVQDNTKITQTLTDIGQVRGAIESLYQGQPSFTPLAIADLVTTLPASLYNGTNLVNAFGGTITIGPDKITTSGDSYFIGVNNLDATACTRLATTDYGRSLIAVNVAATGTPVAIDHQTTVGSVTSLPVTATGAAAGCGLAVAATPFLAQVTLQFH